MIVRPFIFLLLLSLSACSTAPTTPVIEYRYKPVPESLIPKEPVLESIKGIELPKSCVSDETYRKIVMNMRKLKAYSAELRLLLTNKE